MYIFNCTCMKCGKINVLFFVSHVRVGSGKKKK